MSVSRSLGRLSLFDYTFRVRARLHRFLLLLLMLTLPVQAFAYAGMQGCVSQDPGAAEQMAVSDEAMMNCHSPEHPDSAPAQHECKFCAACALASALPTEFVDSTLVVPIADRFAAQPAASYGGFIPDGPERPPRPALA